MDKAKLVDDLLLEPRSKTQWLVECLVPARGIVFLYGKPSIGKSPLTWKLAQVVSDGGDFFGYPVRAIGPVLYIDVDTPKEQVVPRLEFLIPKPSQAFWTFDNPVDIVHPTPKLQQEMKQLAEEVKPVLVIWNTLRKLHGLDDKDSNAPSKVYAAMMRMFPTAAHLVAHHDKKTIISRDSKTDPDEAFSGSQAWLNDAQVGLHLVPVDKKLRKSKLVHTKSQVSELQEPIDLQLGQDGTTWLNVQSPAIVEAFMALPESDPIDSRLDALAEQFDQSKRTIRRKLTTAGLLGKAGVAKG